MKAIALIGLVLLLGVFGRMDYESVADAEAHRLEAIEAAKTEAKQQRIAMMMAKADYMIPRTK